MNHLPLFCIIILILDRLISFGISRAQYTHKCLLSSIRVINTRYLNRLVTSSFMTSHEHRPYLQFPGHSVGTVVETVGYLRIGTNYT